MPKVSGYKSRSNIKKVDVTEFKVYLISFLLKHENYSKECQGWWEKVTLDTILVQLIVGGPSPLHSFMDKCVPYHWL